MKIREDDLDLDGLRLKRYTFAPDDPADIRAAALHYHGQGDYSERYDETMQIFTQEGIACIATDLPGHGRSPGTRGRVSGFDLVDRIAESSRSACRELCPAPHGPLGVFGHSAGGLMALRDLLLRPRHYSFSWISSPLVKPEANQKALLVRLAPVLAHLPGLTVNTRVVETDCVHTDTEDEPPLDHRNGLFHTRVSIGWGYAMMVAAREVREGLVSSPPSLPLLITQGGIDPVCPPEYLREVLSRAAIPNLSYREFPDALHEPFADSGKEEVFAAMREWVQAVLGSPDLAPSPPPS